MSVYEIDEWGVEDDGWNVHASGAPGRALVSNAIQVWAVFQKRPVSVAEAARAFNLAPARVIEAVERHYWMFLAGPRDDPTRLMIEHEGE